MRDEQDCLSPQAVQDAGPRRAPSPSDTRIDLVEHGDARFLAGSQDGEQSEQAAGQLPSGGHRGERSRASPGFGFSGTIPIHAVREAAKLGSVDRRESLPGDRSSSRTNSRNARHPEFVKLPHHRTRQGSAIRLRAARRRPAASAAVSRASSRSERKRAIPLEARRPRRGAPRESRDARGLLPRFRILLLQAPEERQSIFDGHGIVASAASPAAATAARAACNRALPARRRGISPRRIEIAGPVEGLSIRSSASLPPQRGSAPFPHAPGALSDASGSIRETPAAAPPPQARPPHHRSPPAAGAATLPARPAREPPSAVRSAPAPPARQARRHVTIAQRQRPCERSTSSS